MSKKQPSGLKLYNKSQTWKARIYTLFYINYSLPFSLWNEFLQKIFIFSIFGKVVSMNIICTENIWRKKWNDEWKGDKGKSVWPLYSAYQMICYWMKIFGWFSIIFYSGHGKQSTFSYRSENPNIWIHNQIIKLFPLKITDQTIDGLNRYRHNFI
jgi:hypothetical protein